MDSTVGGSQFQVLRELLGDYPSSDCNFVGGDLVIPESAFDGAVGARSQNSPCVTKKILYCLFLKEGERKGEGA